MTMKCIYAIPPEDFEAAKKLAKRYTQALSKLSDDVIALGDDLRAFAETHSAAVLKQEDIDWASACAGLHERFMGHLGEIFWSAERAKLVGKAFQQASVDTARILGVWLASQTARGRSFVLLAE